MRDLLALMRPQQWTKNLVLFAGLVFSQHAREAELVVRAAAIFVAFCLLSSSVYASNDVADVGRDRMHPKKKNRPVASGRVSTGAAAALAACLAAAGLAIAFALGPAAGATGAVYLALNLLYSFSFKHLVILDVFCISLGFVLRAIGGVEALRPLEAAIAISPWLLVCTLFLALFLALCKRRQELVSLEAGASEHRKSLADYSTAMLDQMIGSVTAVLILAYCLYTIWPGTVEKFGTEHLLYTVPFVVYGIFRYVYLVYRRQEGGNPSEVLLRDRPIELAILGWGIVVAMVLY